MGKEPARAFRLVDAPEPIAPVRPNERQEMTEARGTPLPSRSTHKKNTSSPTSAPRRATSEAADVRNTDPTEAAVARAVSLLAYGDMSRRKLIRKLTDRNISPELAERAADICEERGYLREADACLRRAEQGARKGWGPRRIAEELYVQRYPRECIEDALATLADKVDFTAACAAVIRKKYHDVPTDRDARRRMIAALARLGYGMEDIRTAIAEVAAEGKD